MEIFVQTITDFFDTLGYAGIAALMAVESSLIPFPSEVVIPPAAYLAAKGEFNIYLVIISGVAGSLAGAIFNYYLALYIGRTAIYKLVGQKYAKYLLLSTAKLKSAEDYFLRYGRVSTFIGRLVPAIRQLISLPAGFSRMKFFDFIIFTFLGSAAWVIILALLGYYLGSDQESLRKYYKEIGYFFLAAFIVFVVYAYFKKRSSK